MNSFQRLFALKFDTPRIQVSEHILILYGKNSRKKIMKLYWRKILSNILLLVMLLLLPMLIGIVITLGPPITSYYGPQDLNRGFYRGLWKSQERWQLAYLGFVIFFTMIKFMKILSGTHFFEMTKGTYFKVTFWL